MYLIDRHYVEIDGDKNNNPKSGFLKLFEDAHGLIILGDPGMGKTTSFKIENEKDKNAAYIRAIDFYTMPEKLLRRNYFGKTLYIDGLDEVRARTKDGVEKIRDQLALLDVPKFRLSCRSLEWGNSDLNTLASTLQINIRTLKLEPLTFDQIQNILKDEFKDPEEFMLEAKNKNFINLLKNPHNLKLFLKIYKSGQKIENRLDLFQKAVKLLVSEENEEHAKGDIGEYSETELLNAAGKLSLVFLLSNCSSLAVTKRVATPTSPYVLGDLDSEKKCAKQVLKTRLFDYDSEDVVFPCHRTVAEFLAASYLVSELRKGFPLSRVLSWITGFDHGTLADLRGLYAWLTTLYEEKADLLLVHDPLGLFMYGDISRYSDSNKRAVLKAFRDLSKQHPYFLSATRQGPANDLVSENLVEDFRKILNTENPQGTYYTFILEILAMSRPMPALSPLMISLINNPKIADHQKNLALEVYILANPDDGATLTELLKKITSGKLSDDTFQMRARIIEILYPKNLSPVELIEFIVSDRESNFIGNYYQLLEDGIVERTKGQNLLELATAINSIENSDRKEFVKGKLSPLLSLRVLQRFGEEITGEKLFNLLECVEDKYKFNLCRKDAEISEAHAEYWRSKPEVFKKIFFYWVTKVYDPAKSTNLQEFNFEARVNGNTYFYPEDFGQWLFSLMQATQNESLKDYLFQVSLEKGVYTTKAAMNPAYEEFWDYALKNGKLELIKKLSIHDLPENYFKYKIGELKEKEERLADEKKFVEQFREDAPRIIKGEAWGHLYNLMWRRRKPEDIDKKFEITETILPQDLQKIAHQGFKALILNPKLPSLEKMAEAASKNKYFQTTLPFAYGCTLAWRDNDKWHEECPTHVVKQAIAAKYLSEPYAVDSDEWYLALIKDRPQLVKNVVEVIIQNYIKNDKLGNRAFENLLTDPMLVPIAKELIPRYLLEYRNLPFETLNKMLQFFLKHGEWEKLSKLASREINKKNDSEIKRNWFAAAFLANPNQFLERYDRYVGNSKQRLNALLELIQPNWKSDYELELNYSGSVKLQERMSIIIGRNHPKFIEMSNNVMPSRYTQRKADRIIEKIFLRLSSDISMEANEALRNLSGNPLLKQRRERILNYLNDNTQKLRQAFHEYSTADEILKLVRGGKPINSRDLKAFITDHLITLKEQYSGLNTDIYAKFWGGKPPKSLSEGFCRDRIIDDLREKLLPLGIHLEPEGAHAAKKNSDIKIISTPTCVIPIEIKKNKNKEIWKGVGGQLIKQYSNDPTTGGCGIYLALWFGKNEQVSPPRALKVKKPQTPEELKTILQSLIPENKIPYIDVLVIDLSVAPTSKQKLALERIGKAKRRNLGEKKTANRRKHLEKAQLQKSRSRGKRKIVPKSKR